MQLSFSHKKAIQALNFFAQSAGGQINKMKALKLVFFADRYHLRKYGRPITNDSYFAMKFGPVASACLNLLNEDNEFTAPSEIRYRDLFLERHSSQNFSSTEKVDPTVISATDLEALRYTWETYQDKDQYQLADESHRFPEWRQHEAALNAGETRRLMSYSDFLQNPETGVEPLSKLSSEEIEDIKEELEEMHSVESIWS